MPRTPSRPARIDGRALFTGGRATARLLPSTDWRWRVGGDWHPLHPKQLAPLPHRTRLVAGDDVLVLPEHLLAACLLLDLDGVAIDAPQGEVPIGDGSAGPFVRALQAAGVHGPRRSRLSVRVTWRGRTATWRSGEHGVAWARTFIEARAARPGLFPGATPGCSLVLDDGGRVLAGRGRGLGDERAAHKLLDVLGDLAPRRALGPLRGHVEAVEPSHLTNPHLEAA